MDELNKKDVYLQTHMAHSRLFETL